MLQKQFSLRGFIFFLLPFVLVTQVHAANWTGSVSTAWTTAGNWSTGVVPTSTTDVVIPSVATLPTISSSVNCRALTINAGATLTTSSAGTLNITGNITNSGTMTNSGTTNFNGSAAQTFSGVTTFNNLTLNNAAGLTLGGAVTINGNLTVTSGTLTTNNYNISLAGNLTNNGSFSAGTGMVTFTGSTSKTVTGSSTTAFNTITVNKGTDNSSIIDVQSVITMASDGLRIINGTFKLSSSSTITPWTAEITSAPYNIPSTGGLWVNGGTVSTTSNISFAGLVRASAGTLNIGDAADEKLYLRPGSGAITVDGGALNVSGRLSYTNTTDVLTFNMSAGTFTLGSMGNTVAVAPFTIYSSSSSFTMSGGTIIIVQSATSNFGYLNAAGTSSVTGGTLQIGNTSTPAANTMDINSTPAIWNLTVNSTNAPTARLSAALVVKNIVTISGGTLNTNNLNLTVGGNWVNNGTFTAGTSTVTFNGTTTMSGSTVTNTFNNLTVSASSTVTSSATLTGLVVNGTLTTGASASLDLGTTTVLSGTLGTISNSGTIVTSVPTTTSATPIPASKTWGGTIDYANASANQTVVGGTYNNLTVRPGSSKVATASGNLVVNGTLTVNTAFGALDLSTYVLSGSLTSIVNNGDIKTSVPTSTSATPIPSGKTWGGTIYYNATAGAQTVVGGTYNILRFSNTSGTNTASGDLTVNNQFVTTAGGTLDMGSSYRIINMSGTITNNGTVKTSVLTTTSATPFATGKTWGGTGTVEYAAITGAQTVVSGTYNNLKLSNTSGTQAVDGNITVGGVFTLTGGTITTATYSIYINSTGSVSRTSGHVIGNLKKYIATGATSKTFEIGDASNYTPATVAFASVTTAGDLTVTVTNTDHPNLSGSGIRTDKSANRYFTLTNSAIVFTTATLTMNWVAADVDAGATTSNFSVANYNSSTWTLPTAASPLSTSIQATGLTTLAGDYAAGERCTLSSGFSYAASPYCSSAGSATPTISGTAGTFSSTAGLSINSTTGVVNLSASTAGTYTVTNSASSSGGCTSSSTASITITAAPTTANAGADQTGSATCGLTTVTLTGNTPSTGTGAWSIISGTGGTVTTPSSPTSTFTGTAGTTYTLRWTISNGSCTSIDDVIITFSQNPTTSNAGADQTGSATCGLTTVTLAGNTPSVGTGAWSILSGTGGTVTTPSSATSTFTGSAGSTYTLRWTTTNGACSSTDNVIITFNQTPTTSNAGPDQTGAATCGVTTVTLAGNTPSVGTGAWSIVSGTGGTVNTPSSPTSTFSGTAGTTYTLRWTISNSPCTASTDDVIITFNQNSSATISYAGNPYCSSAGTATVTRTGAAGGTYSSTSGLVINATTGDITLASSTAGTYTVTYTMVNGVCTTTATTSITITTQPFANGYYAGNPYCSNGGIAYPTGTSSGAAGTLSSTAGLTLDPSNGVVTLGSSTPGTYTVTYTVPASGGCAVYTTSSTITITAAPSASISYSGSPYCITAGTATVTRTGTAGGTYSSTAGLSINASTGDITLASSTAGTYTVTYTVAAASGCAQYTTTTSVTISATSTWSGAVSSNWNTAGNWSCNSLPGSSSNVVIPTGLSTYPVIATSSTGTTNNITIQSGGTLTVNGTLQIAGSITNSGTLIASSGTIVMNGSSAQTIAASTFAGNIINGLTVNNTSGVTLGGALGITDALTVSAGNLTTGGYLTLKSSATANARVAPVTSAAATPINGNVTVERYVPGRRRYRLITSSVTTSASSSLSVGQESLSIWGNWQNSGNTTTGNVGTYITGGASADGFDTQTANASLFTYDDVNRKYTGFTTANGKNTKYTPLKAGIAYYMFVYGDRTKSITTSTPNNTVLSATGTLVTGDQTYNTSSAIPLSNVTGRYTLLGNPFASPIDWGSLPKTNLSSTYWGWDPNLSATGGYITVSTTGTATLIAPFSGTIGLNQYIQAGQGFFVKTTASAPSLTIREADKVSNFNSSAFRTASPNSIPLLAVNLQYNNGAAKVLADGALAAFDAGFSIAITDDDASKLSSGNAEEIAINNASQLLSIDARPLPQDKDTILLNLTKLTKPQYILEIFSQQLDANAAQPYLEDSYLNTSVQLSVSDTNRIVFDVNPDPASSAANRFRIVFKQANILPVTFTLIQATAKDKTVQVHWQVAVESGVLKYAIERSADGVNFTSVAEVAAKGNSSAEDYTWLDAYAATGNNYYRIRAIYNDGKISLTKTVLATIDNNTTNQLLVFPNPIINRQIKFQLNAIEKGQYTLQLYNSQGQIILNQVFDHRSETTNHLIQLDKKPGGGMYYLHVACKHENYYQSILIQ